MGAPHLSHDHSSQSDFSGTDFSHERIDRWDQRNPLISIRPARRSFVRHLGPKVFPLDHRLLHVRADPADEDQHVVVLRDDFDFRRFRGHLFSRFCLRRGRHRRERSQRRLRTRFRDVRGQSRHESGIGSISRAGSYIL